jgi:hypothetical protein
MGIRPEELTDAMKERMDIGDKQREIRRLGKRYLETQAEAETRKLLELEREDHGSFSNELLRQGLEFEHDDPVRRTRNRVGWPDFRIFFGPPPGSLFVEFKKGKNKLSKEQEEKRRYLEAAGHPYVVAYSLSEAIEAVHRYILQRS